MTAFAARIGLWLAKRRGAPLKIGKTIIAARYDDVREILSRDLDFLIQPSNGPRFDKIGYHFILGMDRSGELIEERETLYAALDSADMDALRQAATADAAERLAENPEKIDLIEDYARPVAAATAQRLFGIAPENSTDFMNVSRAIFGYCFLDSGNSKAVEDRALAAAEMLTGWFDAEIARRRKSGRFGDDMMGGLLGQAGVSDDLVRRSLGGMLVGSIDTTASCVAKIMTVLLRDRALCNAATRDCDNPRRLYGWCQEALRRWPHGPIVGRQAARDTHIGKTQIAAGANVIGWTQAAMMDPRAFPRPKAMRPDRPPQYYLHFGAELHACAGRGVNAWQITLLVSELLRQRPRRLGRMKWAGPFPAHLDVQLAGERS